MASPLRVMCWNIAEGRRDDRTLPPDSALPEIADQIRAKSPDIVLLNEAHNTRGWPFGSGVNQVLRLSELTGMPHCHWAHTVATGLTGHKAVGVLSRFPLGPARIHPVMRGTTATTYATIETTVTVNTLVHHIFSTRFDHANLEDNSAGHQQATNLVQSLGRTVPIIFGGDFNAEPQSPQMLAFITNSGLKDVYLQKPDPQFGDPEHMIDRIFYRGPYDVSQMEIRSPWPGEMPVSDHPWVFAELQWTEPAECGQVRTQIAELTGQIRQLEAEKQGLNPRNRTDLLEINRINREITRIGGEIGKIREQARASGCWL